MTEGIISGLSRSLPVSETLEGGGSYTIPDIIQTDAAINPGNSGGVLLNVQGQVVGVTAAIRTDTNSNTGIGFVIPSNIVSRVVPVLIDTGSYEHPRLGISGLTLTSSVAEAADLDPDQKGVLVIEVVANGPAQRAGLRGGALTNVRGGQVPAGGDVIIAIEDTPVSKFEDLTSYIFNNTQVGQTVSLTILRQGREQTIDLILGVLSPLSGQ
jgi:2-alkenal reductase